MIYADRPEGGRGALLDDQNDLMMALDGARLAGQREEEEEEEEG